MRTTKLLRREDSYSIRQNFFQIPQRVTLHHYGYHNKYMKIKHRHNGRCNKLIFETAEETGEGSQKVQGV